MLAALAACGGGHGGSDTPPAPSGLSYASPQTYVVSRQIAPLVPTLTGSVSSWSVTPSLPTGLSLDAASGQISGTPTAPSSSGAYTIIASNQGGSTSTILTITVNDTAPAVTYPSTAFVFTTEVPITPIAPNSAGGAVVSWSIDPALPLGLTLDSGDGSITGTPTTAQATATYTVTATNSGGTTTATLQFGVDSGVLLDLGHATSLQLIRYDGSRIFSLDSAHHWVLWNAQTGASIARGEATNCNGSSPCTDVADLAGPVFVVWTATGLDVRSSSDGRVLAHIAAAPPEASTWSLAKDGSYVAIGDSSRLAAWSPSGAMLWSRPGNYAPALLYADPGETLVARGPAGVHSLETIDATNGSVSATSTFQGDFNFWFGDGSHFATNLATTNWFYSSDGVLRDVWISNTKVDGGVGNWFWTRGTSFDVYAVGSSGAPAASYLGIGVTQVSHGLLVASGDPYQLIVIDLTGSTPTRSDHSSPLQQPTTFAALSPSDWIIGDATGLLANASTPASYYGLGGVLAIAGSSRRFAVATRRGGIDYYDATTKTKEGHIDLGSPANSAEVLLSDDGTILAVLPDIDSSVGYQLGIFTLPDGTLVKSWLYPASGDTHLGNISLSGSGLVVGKAGRTTFNSTYWREIDTTAGVTIWSNFNDSTNAAPLLSPDGSLAALAEPPFDQSATTQILKNGVLSTVVAGYPVGWIDDNRLLITIHPFPIGTPSLLTACAIANPVGTTVQNCKVPTEVTYMQRVGPDSIYSPSKNTIYAVSTGEEIWTSPNPIQGPGAVAGSYVVFVSNGTIRAERYQ
jgi:hypothetical protein